MKYQETDTVKKIKKLYVETTVMFAIESIPTVDEYTLQKFLELVNATGNFGFISEEQLVEKMKQIQKYIPNACGYSLLTVAELLGIEFSWQSLNDEAAVVRPFPSNGHTPVMSPAWQY